MPDALAIRPAEPSDAATLLRWRNDPASYLWYHEPAEVSEREHIAWLHHRLSRATPALWLVELNGEPAGSVRLDDLDAPEATISVVVDSALRGQGIGSRLLAWADRQAIEAGCRAVIAEVHPGNTPSIALFTRAGYLPDEGARPGFLRFRKPLAAPSDQPAAE